VTLSSRKVLHILWLKQTFTQNWNLWERVGMPGRKKFEKILPSDISNVSNDILFNGKKATASYVYFPKLKHTYVLRPDPKLLSEY
jgi:hypothetical protein